MPQPDTVNLTTAIPAWLMALLEETSEQTTIPIDALVINALRKELNAPPGCRLPDKSQLERLRFRVLNEFTGLL